MFAPPASPLGRYEEEEEFDALTDAMKRKLVVLVAAPAAGGADGEGAAASVDALRAFLQPLQFAQAFSSQQVKGAGTGTRPVDAASAQPTLLTWPLLGCQQVRCPTRCLSSRNAHPGRRPCTLRSRCGRAGTGLPTF